MTDEELDRIKRAEEIQRYTENRCEALEKENAELKTKVTALENANRAMVKELDDTTSGGLNILQNVVKNKEELTKAKELICNLLRVTYGEGWNYSLDWKVKAEQFLKEVEK